MTSVRNKRELVLSMKDVPQPEFLHRVSYQLHDGDFRLDCSNGEIQFHLAWPDEFLYGPNVNERLCFFVFTPHYVMSRFSAGIHLTLAGFTTPEHSVQIEEMFEVKEVDEVAVLSNKKCAAEP
ncbi:MAG: hypothetical protein IJQ73_03525 [Kiritimatiellae bacterium]|nr:hypothetical protein [Kiritimatiellia bacterium]